MVQPLSKPKIIKKFGNKKFNRHQHDRKMAVKVRCRAVLGVAGPGGDRRRCLSRWLIVWQPGLYCCCYSMHDIHDFWIVCWSDGAGQCSTLSSSRGYQEEELAGIEEGGWSSGGNEC